MKRIHRLFLTVLIVAMLTAVVPTTQAARPQAAVGVRPARKVENTNVVAGWDLPGG